MATTQTVVSVTTTPTAINSTADTGGIMGQSSLAYNDGAVTVYLGGSNVTTANGYPFPAGASLTIDAVSGDDVVYGVVASGTCNVRLVTLGV